VIGRYCPYKEWVPQVPDFGTWEGTNLFKNGSYLCDK
jgi:hypothetical protein